MNSSRHDVPAFQSDEISPKQHRYCICPFVINEGERVRSQIRTMHQYTSMVDVIIADGGSTDGSLDREFLAAHGVSVLLTKKGPGKLSAQMRMALHFALERGYEGVIVVDGNNKDGMEAIPHFVAALDEGFDHIQGSRYVAGGKAINTPASRHWGVKLLHAPLISLAAGFHYTDTTNGFRGYSRRLLTHPLVQPFREIFSRYELHYYLAIRAARLGLRVKEVGVTRSYPSSGEIPTKISPFKGNLLILRTLFKAVTHQYNPDSSREHV